MHFALLFAFITAAAADYMTFNTQLDYHWNTFKYAFGKSYSYQEEPYHRAQFEARVADIANHNLGADMGLYTYTKGINKYSALTHYDFVSIYNGFHIPANATRKGSSWVPHTNVQTPDSVDWTKSGYVTPIKDQGTCGSCWSFSTTGALEGQTFKKTGHLVSLSEQNLVDCSISEGTQGCNGGWMDDAYEFIKTNGGINSEQDYPYTGQVGTCHYMGNSVAATCSGHVDIPTGDEDAMKTAVATIGPISVAIDASHEAFMSYKDGIYQEPTCSTTALDHAVLVVGYGSDGVSDYWLVKNSWGTTWGINGYFKIARNKGNMCGIATQASYPLV